MSKAKRTAPGSSDDNNMLIGSKLNFEGREAYNLLRTNLMLDRKSVV